MTGGRKVVELRPDIDWDKGTALAWIRDRIHQTGRVLPIYVGDDLTDEDAFDADSIQRHRGGRASRRGRGPPARQPSSP